MSGYYLDAREFIEGVKRFNEKVLPPVMRKGLFAAAAELLQDADRVEPKTPVKEGHLKGSKKIEISVDLAGNISVLAGFNIEYASYVHEMVMRHKWTEPGSGPKFLESKLFMFPGKYIGICAEAIRRGGLF
jgi:hypothetical protein